MRPVAIPLLVTTAIVGLSGCGWLPKKTQWAEIRPVQTASAERSASADYASAKASIIDGQYARAIELLVAARAKDPADERILNALGVVYDKLGRFDLSQRYYAEAMAIAPTSEAVLHNMAYSQTLQSASVGLARLDTPVVSPAPEATSAPSPVRVIAVAPEPRLVQVGPNVLRLELAAAPAPGALVVASSPPSVRRAGSAILMINATGRTGAAEAVRGDLRGKGWTIKAAPAVSPTPKSRTTIHYAAQHVIIAKALARTLWGGAALVPCGEGCGGLRLVLGADARLGGGPTSGGRKG